MNHRTKSLWLPALITLLGASVSLAATQFMGLQPQEVWVGKMGMTFYGPWLALFPSLAPSEPTCHAGQRDKLRCVSPQGSPQPLSCSSSFLILPWGLFLDGFHFFRLVHFGLGLVNWVGIPATALLLGALPFLRGNNLRSEINR